MDSDRRHRYAQPFPHSSKAIAAAEGVREGVDCRDRFAYVKNGWKG